MGIGEPLGRRSGWCEGEKGASLRAKRAVLGRRRRTGCDEKQARSYCRRAERVAGRNTDGAQKRGETKNRRLGKTMRRRAAAGLGVAPL